METWMIVVAVIAAVIIVCLPKLIKNWYNKSPKMQQIREGVEAIQAFQRRYPEVEDYERSVFQELRNQEADVDFIKDILGDAYKQTLKQAHKSCEDPVHFTDRWLYTSIAPKRWDHIAGILHYYVYIMQVLLDKKCRPTSLINAMGGKQAFIEKIEGAYAKELDPDILIERDFKIDQKP